MNSILNQPWPYLGTAALVGLLGFYSWRQPHRPGTRYFSWMVAIWFAWALASAFDTQVRSFELSYTLWAVQVFCALSITSLQLLFSLEYTDHGKLLAWRGLYIIGLPALIFAIAAIFMPVNYLVSLEVVSGRIIIVANSVLLSGLYLAMFSIWLVNLGVLVGRFVRAPAFRIPIILMILGQIVTRLGALAVSLKPGEFVPSQAIILLSNFSALSLYISLYYFRILRVAPVARDQAIQRMSLALIVLDIENRLVDYNPAAETLPGLNGNLGMNQPAEQVLGEWWPHFLPLLGLLQDTSEVHIQTTTGQRSYQIHSQPILQASGWRIGQEFLLQDVTQAWQSRRQQAQTLWAQATLEERVQLADDLHDGLSQDLAFLNLQSQAALLYLQRGQNQAAESSMARLSEAAGEIQENTRELIGDLLSVSLPAVNFLETLRQALSQFQVQTGLITSLEARRETRLENRPETRLESSPETSPETSLESSLENSTENCLESRLHPFERDDAGEFCTSDDIPPAIGLQLLRITQEALANVRKHARGASQVWVKMGLGDQELVLTISDNGAGFDPNNLYQSGKHYGLRVMRQRAARIGGTVSVTSTPGKGALVEIWVPLGEIDEITSLERRLEKV